MASIRKRGNKWQAQVRRSGSTPVNRTFNAREDAVRWAREQDRAIDRGECSSSIVKLGGDLRVSELLHQYQRDVSPRKRSVAETFHLRTITRAIGTYRVSSLQPSHLALYRDQRLKEVTPATVVREMAIFCHVLKTAVDEWGLSLPVEKFRAVSKPSLPPGRTRRLLPAEAAALLEALTQCHNPVVKSAFLFALATGMRRGEVLSLTWANVDFENRVAFLPMTKNGEPRRVPLSTEAIETLQSVRESVRESVSREKDQIFPISANALRLAWERAKRRAGIENLRFHDLRHEAISRFFELGLSVPEVSLISGHKDAQMLFRYTHLKPENVAKKIEALTQR